VTPRLATTSYSLPYLTCLSIHTPLFASAPFARLHHHATMGSERETSGDDSERSHAGPQNDQSASHLADSSNSISLEMLEHHHLWETGHDVPEHKDFHLEPSRFQKVHPHLERLFKRFEYDPSKAILTVIMPKRLHAGTVSEILREMANIIDRARATNQNSQVAATINKCHVSIKRDQDFDIHSSDTNRQDVISKVLDLQIKHTWATFPGLVIEVAYSQTAVHSRRELFGCSRMPRVVSKSSSESNSHTRTRPSHLSPFSEPRQALRSMESLSCSSILKRP
jgi:hypothetical protein